MFADQDVKMKCISPLFHEAEVNGSYHNCFHTGAHHHHLPCFRILSCQETFRHDDVFNCVCVWLFILRCNLNKLMAWFRFTRVNHRPEALPIVQTQRCFFKYLTSEEPVCPENSSKDCPTQRSDESSDGSVSSAASLHN